MTGKTKKVFLKSKLLIVTKLVIITNSLGIIINDKNKVNNSFFPLNSNLEKAKEAKIVTATIDNVVMSVNITVLNKYLPKGTAVKALR